ncbi:hypothetical protein [Halalkalibacter flavus]
MNTVYRAVKDLEEKGHSVKQIFLALIMMKLEENFMRNHASR